MKWNEALRKRYEELDKEVAIKRKEIEDLYALIATEAK